MKRHAKLLALVLALAMALALVACGGNSSSGNGSGGNSGSSTEDMVYAVEAGSAGEAAAWRTAGRSTLWTARPGP